VMRFIALVLALISGQFWETHLNYEVMLRAGSFK
jgi:hypothetical protein